MATLKGNAKGLSWAGFILHHMLRCVECVVASPWRCSMGTYLCIRRTQTCWHPQREEPSQGHELK